MKNNIKYYRHEVNSHNHGKFKALRAKYGWAGEGQFWALNNMIGEADGCELDLKKGYNRLSIATDLGMSPEQFDEYIQYLADSCHLITLTDGVISTEMTQSCLEEATKERDRAAKKWDRKKVSAEKSKTSAENSENPRSLPGNFHNNYNYNNNDNKDNNNNEENNHNEAAASVVNKGQDLSFIDPEMLPVYTEWLKYKKSCRQSYKNQQSLEQNYQKLKEFSKGDPELAKIIINESISQGWAGLFPLRNQNGNQNRRTNEINRSLAGPKDYGQF